MVLFVSCDVGFFSLSLYYYCDVGFLEVWYCLEAFGFAKPSVAENCRQELYHVSCPRALICDCTVVLDKLKAHSI